MKKNKDFTFSILLALNFWINHPVLAQIGIRFPSECKVLKDPVTGTELTFLTSTPAGDSKINSMNICIVPVPKKWLKRKY